MTASGANSIGAIIALGATPIGATVIGVTAMTGIAGNGERAGSGLSGRLPHRSATMLERVAASRCDQGSPDAPPRVGQSIN